MKIGIIGYGYVGKAVAAAYEPDQVMINDPMHESATIAEIKSQADAIFICVPTPETTDGSCDTSILFSVLEQLNGYKGIVIAKSTAVPQVYASLEAKYSELKFAHVPEFLTAANAVTDYQFPVQIVIGCKQELRLEVFDIIATDKIRYDMTTVKYCTVAEAAMFKYVANTMLAMKVIMNNEYYDLCKSLGISWDKVSQIAQADPRLGHTHWAVPGNDGNRGFSGGCFPKDTQALLSLAKFMCVEMSMLNSAIKKNKKLRNK